MFSVFFYHMSSSSFDKNKRGLHMYKRNASKVYTGMSTVARPNTNLHMDNRSILEYLLLHTNTSK